MTFKPPASSPAFDTFDHVATIDVATPPTEAMFVMVGPCAPARLRRLHALLENNGFLVGHDTDVRQGEENRVAIRTRFLVIGEENASPCALPSVTQAMTSAAIIAQAFRTIPYLRVAVALGVAAHTAVVEACGVPRHRIPFRPDTLTRLPDGLLLADTTHPGVQRPSALSPLLARIANALESTGDNPKLMS